MRIITASHNAGTSVVLMCKASQGTAQVKLIDRMALTQTSCSCPMLTDKSMKQPVQKVMLHELRQTSHACRSRTAAVVVGDMAFSSDMGCPSDISKKLTWQGSFCLRHGVLLGSCQELPQPGDGHLGIHQLTNQLRQLEQWHPQNLQAVATLSRHTYQKSLTKRHARYL